MSSLFTPGSLWSQNIIWNLEDQFPEEIPKKIPDKVSNKASDKVSNKASDKVSNKASDKVSNKASDKVSYKASDKVSYKASDKVSDKVSCKASDKVSCKASDKVSCKASDKVSNKASDKVSNKASDNISNEASDNVSNEASDNVSNEASDKVSNEASDETSHKVSDKVECRGSRRKSYSSSISSEESEKSVGGQYSIRSLEQALKEERKAKASLEEALTKERKGKALLKGALEKQKKSKAQLQNALEQKRKQKHSLEKSLKEVEVEMDLMKKKVASLKKSHQKEKAKLEGTITEITATLVSNQKLTVDLKKDLEVSAQHKKEMAERETANCAEIKALQERLMKQKEESLEKDMEIKSLHFKIQTNFETKDIVSLLQERVKQQASDLEEEREKNCALKRDYGAAVSQQRKDQDKLDHLIQANQDLVSKKKMLQDELDASLKKQLDQKQLLEDRHCSTFEEAFQKEKARFSEASEKIQKQKEELSLKTLALEKSLMAEEHLKSSLKKEQKHYEQMLQRQESAATFLKNQLKEASAKSERLMYDLQTLKMDNADIRGKFNALEKDNDELNSKQSSLVKCVKKKNQIIKDLEYTVNGLRAQESEDKTKRATAEVALKYETTRNSELQEKVNQISSGLDIDRAKCEKYCDELKESLKRQIEILGGNQKLTFKQNSDTEVGLQLKTALDETTEALHHLQQEYIELGKRHSDINSDYRELLKTHSALKFRHERLSYAQGNPRPVFSPLSYTACF